MLKLLSDFGRKLDFGLPGLGKEFRKVAPFFFRLGLVILFFWYFAAIVSELLPHHELMAWTLAIAAIAVLATFVVILVRRFHEFAAATDMDKEQKSSIIPFFLMNLPFVFAVGFADLWWGHSFSDGLLRFTQDILHWIRHYFS